MADSSEANANANSNSNSNANANHLFATIRKYMRKRLHHNHVIDGCIVGTIFIFHQNYFIRVRPQNAETNHL